MRSCSGAKPRRNWRGGSAQGWLGICWLVMNNCFHLGFISLSSLFSFLLQYLISFTDCLYPQIFSLLPFQFSPTSCWLCRAEFQAGKRDSREREMRDLSPRRAWLGRMGESAGSGVQWNQSCAQKAKGSSAVTGAVVAVSLGLSPGSWGTQQAAVSERSPNPH